ncbi:MAG: hypothetical protein ACRDM0_16210 [Thermoleophilaceae bacterium]
MIQMCHEWWTRQEKRRQERFDEELHYLLDEERERSKPTPVVEHEREEEPDHRERPVEAVRS